MLVDGGVTDPLPFTALRGKADVIVAVDVSGGGADAQGVPDPWESLFTAISVMGHTIVAHKLKEVAPDLVLRPNIGIFRMLDFFQASAILRVADPIKAEVKEKLGALPRELLRRCTLHGDAVHAHADVALRPIRRRSSTWRSV